MRGVRMIGVILAGTLLTGCGGQPASPAPGRASSPPAPFVAVPRPDPIVLIGLWTPIGAGEQPDALLRISAHRAELFRRCHSLSGVWDADEAGLFVGTADTYAAAPDRSGCASEAPPSEAAELWPWLTSATAFRVAESDRLLLDRHGRVLVRLQPSTRPVDRPDLPADQTGVPVVTDEVRRDYLPAVPLPAGLQPVTPAALLGRWGPKPAPAADDARRPYVEFRDAGRWTGSDGCNGQGGRWAAGPAGSFVATAGSSTLIGCDNVSVQAWMDSARRAGFDRNVLVLLDGTGNVVGRFNRIGGAKAPTSRRAPGP